MPIYEFKCRDCGRLSSVFTRSIASPVDAECKHCGSRALERALSRFAYHKSEQSVLADYGASPVVGVTQVTIVIMGLIPEEVMGNPFGVAYVTIHLDYGFKGVGGWQPVDNTVVGGKDAVSLTLPTIPNQAPHTFSFAGTGAGGGVSNTNVVSNLNKFKHDPGFAGSVTDVFGNGLPGIVLKVYGPTGTLVGTAVTDSDGFWGLYWKHTGKAALYTIVACDPEDAYYCKTVGVTVKANGFVIVNIQLVAKPAP